MTTTTTATATEAKVGPLMQVINAFCAKQGELLAKGITGPEDWEPLTEFLDPVAFKRVGAYLEELDWPAYKTFLTEWSKGGTKFEMTEFHINEIGGAVFQEIEERHYRGDTFIRKNVIAVYRFDADNRIIHLDIYEQAKDTGSWIIEAAQEAMA
ncbi:MAG: hypothetical protein KGM17_08150 [Sphingomonadales bacterium]|nr:hypothetical protein [Sphingomonadales bacterium]